MPRQTLTQKLEIANRRAESAESLAVNLMFGRYTAGSRLGITHEGDRDTYKIFGWPRQPVFDDYENLYYRTIGGTAVDKICDDTWKKPPRISEDGNVETPFAREANKLFLELGLWGWLNAADKLANIGRFSLLTFIVEGESDWGQEIDRKESKIVKVSIFSEGNVTHIEHNNDLNSPRYTEPERYTIAPYKDGEMIGDSSMGSDPIHHSRMIHMLANPMGNRVYGRWGMERAINAIMSFELAGGSAAEAFFRNIRRSAFYEVDPRGRVDANAIQEMKDEITAYVNEWRNDLLLQGVKPHQIPPHVVDPTGQFRTGGQWVAASFDMPYRKLFGNEQGQLASEGDDRAWANRIAARQTAVVEPFMLRPVIDWLIKNGAVPAPASEGYHIGEQGASGNWSWPPIAEDSEKTKSEIALNRSNTFLSIARGRIAIPISDGEARMLAGLPEEVPDDYESILDEEDDDLEEAEQQDQGIDGDDEEQGDASTFDEEE